MTLKRASTPSDENVSNAKKAKTPVDIEYDEGYNDPEADITLITSDGVYFKVHSFVLKASSIVFRNMLAVGNEDNTEVNLTDPDFENSNTVSTFLDACCGKAIPEPIDLYKSDDTDEIEAYSDLIKFARKYESNLVLSQLSSLLYKWQYSKLISPFGIFVIAYNMESPDLAAMAIRSCGGRTWALSDTTDEAKAVATDRLRTVNPTTRVCLLDPSGMSEAQLDEMPSPYRWALIRATHNQINEKELSKTDWKKVSNDFLHLIKMSKNYKEREESSNEDRITPPGVDLSGQFKVDFLMFVRHLKDSKFGAVEDRAFSCML
ncbi:uncharacterized protein I206_106563 [Kwoniella pini CBS 10737]|uniref:BTB domain-containing protein n=1 Tax=Kwoniella pini CBS 10737 TaxID=1296096 RepID=A0A1B9HTU8_9TREE|nr:uncharacterized protein I206_07546 [Kwoniella pini CBS 10737]OCF46691.1 hypothetical protein I206_07546 [Kwoniella pini CBS 10737]